MCFDANSDGLRDLFEGLGEVFGFDPDEALQSFDEDGIVAFTIDTVDADDLEEDDFGDEDLDLDDTDFDPDYDDEDFDDTDPDDWDTDLEDEDYDDYEIDLVGGSAYDTVEEALGLR